MSRCLANSATELNSPFSIASDQRKSPGQGLNYCPLNFRWAIRHTAIQRLGSEDHLPAPHPPDVHRNVDPQIARPGQREGRLCSHWAWLRSLASLAKPLSSMIRLVMPSVFSSMSMPVSRSSTFSTNNRISRLRSRGNRSFQKVSTLWKASEISRSVTGSDSNAWARAETSISWRLRVTAS